MILDAARYGVTAAAFFLIPLITHAGTVICAGKTYKDITYAMFSVSPTAGFGFVSLWQGEVHDETAIKQAIPKYTIILNVEITCEFEDLQLHMGE